MTQPYYPLGKPWRRTAEQSDEARSSTATSPRHRRILHRSRQHLCRNGLMGGVDPDLGSKLDQTTLREIIQIPKLEISCK